jgi:hypothetical protein
VVLQLCWKRRAPDLGVHLAPKLEVGGEQLAKIEGMLSVGLQLLRVETSLRKL